MKTLMPDKIDKTDKHKFTINHSSKENLKCIDGKMAHVEITFVNGIFQNVVHNIDLHDSTRGDWYIAESIAEKITELENNYKNTGSGQILKPAEVEVLEQPFKFTNPIYTNGD